MKSRNIVITAVALLVAGWANAQEFKVAKSTGRLEINLGRVTVEGHSGNEIIFTSKDFKGDHDERAKGLTSVNSQGLTDNTGGLGINVQDKGNVVQVNPLKKTNHPDIKILVPKGMIISVRHESQYGNEIKFRNIENEIEVATQYNSVELENVTGPLTVKTIYGHVEADFGTTIKDPVSIVSVYGYVDVTLPLATKANLKLNTSYGEIFVAPEFKLQIDAKSEMREFSDRIAGTIGGGGPINIDLSCNYGKVYLRKK
jgi:hypothetical protein